MTETRHETFQKFGWPETEIASYQHWAVLARPGHVTLGAMVLVAKGTQTRFSDTPPEAFSELAQVIGDIEHAAMSAFNYDQINYLMLMMVDPHVHFHVLPRYARTQLFHDVEFPDAGWPGAPDLSSGTSDKSLIELVRTELVSAWPSRST